MNCFYGDQMKDIRRTKTVKESYPILQKTGRLHNSLWKSPDMLAVARQREAKPAFASSCYVSLRWTSRL